MSSNKLIYDMKCPISFVSVDGYFITFYHIFLKIFLESSNTLWWIQQTDLVDTSKSSNVKCIESFSLKTSFHIRRWFIIFIRGVYVFLSSFSLGFYFVCKMNAMATCNLQTIPAILSSIHRKYCLYDMIAMTEFERISLFDERSAVQYVNTMEWFMAKAKEKRTQNKLWTCLQIVVYSIFSNTLYIWLHK